MGYQLILPRDAFKQGLLLKNIGRLSLLILDSQTNGLELEESFEGDNFQIEQNDDTGNIYLANYQVYLNEMKINFYITSSAREGWCLMGSCENGEYYVFDKDGNLNTNFGMGE